MSVLPLAEIGSLSREKRIYEYAQMLAQAVSPATVNSAITMASADGVMGQVFKALFYTEEIDWTQFYTIDNVLTHFGAEGWGIDDRQLLLKWTTVGNHTFTRDALTSVDVLVVAGGGGGGGRRGGGGGAGGLVLNSSYSIMTSATITVGAGGAGLGSGYTLTRNPGSDSVFSTLTALGGGGGSGGNIAGQDGGSGGGGNSGYSTNGGGATQSGSMSGGDGHNGAIGIYTGSAIQSAGGGGGAGSSGQSFSNGNGGTGGDGLQVWGSWYGGGGGGHGTDSGGLGGSDVGGSGKVLANADHGLPNTGGGGGGTDQATGGNGGSGIVIVRIPLAV